MLYDAGGAQETAPQHMVCNVRSTQPMDTTEEIYPMPAFPILNTTDLAASARWYQEALGFRHVFTMTGPGGMPLLVHLRWVKYADLLLVTRPAAPGPQGQGVVLSFSA